MSLKDATLYADFRSGSLRDWNGSNDGTVTSAPKFNREGLRLDGTDDSVSFGATGLTVKTVVLLLRATTNSEDLADLDGGTHTIEVGAGTVTATGFSSPTIYVGGLESSTLNANDFTTVIVTTATGISASAFVAGAETNFLDGTLGAVAMFEDELTATEVAALQAELNSTKWPSKVNGKAIASLAPELSDASLVGSWRLKPENNTLVDMTGNGNDMSPVDGGIRYGKDLLGHYGDNGNQGYWRKAVSNFRSGDSVGAVSMWLSFKDSTFDYFFTSADEAVNNRYLAFYKNASDQIGITQSNADAGAATNTDLTVPTNDTPCHVVLISNGSSYSIYIDGVEATLSGDDDGDWFADTDNRDSLVLGTLRRVASVSPLNGKIYSCDIFSEEKDAAWVAREYAKGAKALQFKTDFGVAESVANVTAGFLENTMFTVHSGTWKVSSDIIGDKEVKVIECVSAGVLSVPTSLLNQTPSEAAYGTWEWWLNKADGSSSRIMPVATVKGAFNVSASQDGYMIDTAANENIVWRSITNGAVDTILANTANGTATASSYEKYKITRNGAGVWSLYLNDVLLTANTGDNPSTDNTYTTSDYVNFDLDAGDKIALADLTGDHSITKYLGVV